jgi:MOB kinase activator 1
MDGEEVKKPVKCSAPEYVDYLMTWVQSKLDNETIFPSRTDVRVTRRFLFFFLKHHASFRASL